MRMLMNINAKKLRLINLILNTEKSSVLKKIDAIFDAEADQYLTRESSISFVDFKKGSQGSSKTYKVS